MRIKSILRENKDYLLGIISDKSCGKYATTKKKRKSKKKKKNFNVIQHIIKSLKIYIIIIKYFLFN